MIMISAREPARAWLTGPRGWRAAAGLAAVLGGAAMLTGAFLPWVETFAGLIGIPGVRGSYGRVLAVAGAVIALTGLYQLIRGGRWPRWLAGLGGFAAAGFCGYLLIQVAATTRSLGSDSMVLARGGPGLWVTAAGALLAFMTLFLPMPPAATGRDAEVPATADQARAGRVRQVTLGRAADLAADLTSAGPRRWLQVALGLVWLADAALQFQPYMFTRAFASQMLAPTAAGNPAFLASPALWASRLMGHDMPVWNSAFALIQLAIAVGVLWRPTVKAALAASIAWSLGVWWIGEGLGGLLTGTATPLTGAPGAVILYALLAVLAWPAGPIQPAPAQPAPAQPAPAEPGSARPGPGGIAAASPLGRHGSRAVWLVLWASFGYLVLQPVVRAPRALAGTLAAGAPADPGWLAAADRWAASAAGAHGLAVPVTLAVVFLLIATGILLPATTRPALILAAILAAAIWVIGENFGEIFTGMGTDPNTGPLLVLLAAAYWPLHPGRSGNGPPRRTGARSGDPRR